MADDKKHKILIVEDESLLSDMFSRRLDMDGFDVTVIENGEKALSSLKKDKFDLILLDLTMPGMDGFQVLGELKTLHNKTPIIVMSNLSQSEDVEKTKALGAWNYIVKSNTTPKEIVALVRQCITEHKCD